MDQLKILKKISREFRIDLGSGHLDFSQAGLLADTTLAHTSEFLVGNGFRLRWKFPGTSDSVVFNQYNPRSLIDSLQEGYGNNWSVEHFNGTHFKGKVGFIKPIYETILAFIHRQLMEMI